jgi:hypothetical protein
MTNGGGQSALKLRVGGFHSPRKQLFCSPRRDTAQCSPLSMLATHGSLFRDTPSVTLWGTWRKVGLHWDMLNCNNQCMT